MSRIWQKSKGMILKNNVKNFRGTNLNSNATVFGDSRMGIMLPLEPDCMTREVAATFKAMAERMYAEENAEEFNLALTIEAYPDGDKYFVLEMYGYVGDEEIQDSRRLNLPKAEADYYYNMACNQIMKNIKAYTVD